MKYTKSISLVLLGGMVAMPFSACQSMSGGQKIATGAVSGVALGALVGNLIGGDTKSTLIGAGIGIAVGLIGGYVWSESTVKERSAYPSSQAYVQANNQQLDTRIAQAQQANRQASTQIATMQQKKQTISAADKKKQTQTMAKNIQLMNKDIQTAQKATQEAEGDELKELRAKINALSLEKQQMEANRQAIASISTI